MHLRISKETGKKHWLLKQKQHINGRCNEEVKYSVAKPIVYVNLLVCMSFSYALR